MVNELLDGKKSYKVSFRGEAGSVLDACTWKKEWKEVHPKKVILGSVGGWADSITTYCFSTGLYFFQLACMIFEGKIVRAIKCYTKELHCQIGNYVPKGR